MVGSLKDDKFLVRTRSSFIDVLAISDEVVTLHCDNEDRHRDLSDGTWNELLLLHQSISFSFNECVLRIALALKNEVIVKNLTPAKLASSSRWLGSGARTVLTILPDSIVPLFFRRSAGFTVLPCTPILKFESRALCR